MGRRGIDAAIGEGGLMLVLLRRLFGTRLEAGAFYIALKRIGG